MADQYLPTDILQLIFIQLDSVRFILRKTPRINSYWKKWATNVQTSLTIHPRDNYKLKIDDIYTILINNTNVIFPNVKELSLPCPEENLLQPLLAKFPKLEKLDLCTVHDSIGSNSVDISQIPSTIKELAIDASYIRTTPDSTLHPVPTFTELQIYKGLVGEDMLKYFPSNIKQLYINPKEAWGGYYDCTKDLVKFTALEVLHVNAHYPIKEYLQMGHTTLRDLLINRFDSGDVEYLSQKNLPALKRLQFSNEDLSLSQIAVYKDMEVVDRLDRYYVSYDERFLKNNPTLIRLRLGTNRHMSDLNYMKNLKELVLARDALSSTIMKKVLTIKTLEKLQLVGKFTEDVENASKNIEPNYNIKELILKDCSGLLVFFRSWAHLLRGLTRFEITTLQSSDEIYSTYMANWTNLEEIKISDRSMMGKRPKWYFPVFPKLRKFYAVVTVDESIFSSLAQSPNLEIAEEFELNAGSTSAFLIENQIYGFLKATKSLYCLKFDTHTPFKPNPDRVESFVMPELFIRITYTNGKSHRHLFSL